MNLIPLLVSIINHSASKKQLLTECLAAERERKMNWKTRWPSPLHQYRVNVPQSWEQPECHLLLVEPLQIPSMFASMSEKKSPLWGDVLKFVRMIKKMRSYQFFVVK
jgi:hypothetical protein